MLTTRTAPLSYAGFWKRVAAAIIDGVILTIGSFAIALVIGALLAAAAIRDPADLESILNLFGIIIGWLYHAWLESSTLQATFGKLAISIMVTDLDGDRISFGRASLRFFGMFISAFIVRIGFLMVPFTRRKQALHDIIAGCLVVNR